MNSKLKTAPTIIIIKNNNNKSDIKIPTINLRTTIAKTLLILFDVG